jgi:hypothetical protein
MKKIRIMAVVAISLSVVTLNSCKKKDASPAVSITATVDGTATNFNANAAALQGTVSGITVTNIQGTSPGGATLSMSVVGTLTAGKTYSDAATNDNDMPLFVYAASATSDDDYLNDDDDASNLPSVTITSVTSTTVDGVFKGLVQNSTGTKSITNGTFHVKIQSHP